MSLSLEVLDAIAYALEMFLAGVLLVLGVMAVRAGIQGLSRIIRNV